MNNEVDNNELTAEFIRAACAPRDSGHASGDLNRANELLARYPELAFGNIYTAAILGDDITVRKFIEIDGENATAKGAPYGWDALTYLCFSKYLRLDGARSDGLMRSAKALLDAGADANSGWFEKEHQPGPEWESVLYGAAGVAHHAGLTGLLLQYGADPSDGEVVYHSPESTDNAALKLLLDTGKLTAEDLALMLIRKHDWHHYEGAKLLLEYGADPNLQWSQGNSPFYHSVLRDNDLEVFELLLDYGGDPTLMFNGRSVLSVAARRGRRDALEAFRTRGFELKFKGVERLIAACAMDDKESIRMITETEPQLVKELLADGGTLLAEFAGTANKEGVGNLLKLGVKINALYKQGNGYYGIAKNSTALHVAAWIAWSKVVKLLIANGADVNALDDNGRSPLMLAVKACVNSFWTYRRSPESVEALLQAGASVDGVEYPSGYAEVDELLSKYKDRI